MDAATLPTHDHVSQPRLLELAGVPEWRLDDKTREVGRRGIAAARAALRSARRRSDEQDANDDHRHPTAA